MLRQCNCYYMRGDRTAHFHSGSGMALTSVQFAAMPTNFVWLSFFWIMGKCRHRRGTRHFWLLGLIQSLIVDLPECQVTSTRSSRCTSPAPRMLLRCSDDAPFRSLNSREGLRDKVAKGAVQLSNFAASPHSMQQSYTDMGHKPPRRVRVSRSEFRHSSSGLTGVAKSVGPRFDGVSVQIETITDYSPQFQHAPKASSSLGGNGVLGVF